MQAPGAKEQTAKKPKGEDVGLHQRPVCDNNDQNGQSDLQDHCLSRFNAPSLS
jgi:hypothetical protein